MSEPVHIAAIDAGSNAVRLSVVRAHSAIDLEPLHDERYPLRLGESVFVRHRFSEEILKKGIKAFRHFQEVMEEFGVTRYRAVATSASREAQNRDAFVRRIRQKSKIRLEVISAAEESRLGREGVFAALGPESPLRCVVDLGGGSLEVSILRDHNVAQSAQLPVGTVRLMTTLGIPGIVSVPEAEQVRKYLRALLESRLTPRPNLGGELAVALGGNAETLADLAPGPREHGLSTLELSLLRERLPDLLKRDIESRMKTFGVRRDRADVMGIAGLIFVTLGRYLNLRTFSIPRVGIREGLLREIAREAFSRKEPHRYNADARQLLVGTRAFARRLDSDRRHAEHIALNGDIAGLTGRDRNLVAAIVRYHNRKAEPSSNHPAYSALNNSDKRLACRLASILRIAEGLDHSHRQRINKVQAKFQRGAVGLQISARGDAAEDLRDANRSADLFEHEFHVRLYFRPV